MAGRQDYAERKEARIDRLNAASASSLILSYMHNFTALLYLI